VVLSFFPTNSFLGTGATFGADLNLVVQLVMGVALIAGAFLARHKHYKAHGICQTTVLLLNSLMIGLVMGPSFQQQVKPALSRVRHKWYYEVVTIHGVMGIVAVTCPPKISPVEM
jgi:Ca2+/H+ antiporter